MFDQYFVLITEEVFGVFKISAKYYPRVFLENIAHVTVVSENDLKRFLIDKIGRNILVNKGFDIYYSIGKVFQRKYTS